MSLAGENLENPALDPTDKGRDGEHRQPKGANTEVEMGCHGSVNRSTISSLASRICEPDLITTSEMA
jgi:hypothetical protein